MKAQATSVTVNFCRSLGMNGINAIIQWKFVGEKYVTISKKIQCCGVF